MTAVFPVREGQHNKEAVHLAWTIWGPHVVSCTCAVLCSPGPEGYTHKFLACRLLFTLYEHFSLWQGAPCTEPIMKMGSEVEAQLLRRSGMVCLSSKSSLSYMMLTMMLDSLCTACNLLKGTWGWEVCRLCVIWTGREHLLCNLEPVRSIPSGRQVASGAGQNDIDYKESSRFVSYIVTGSDSPLF